MLVFLNPPPPAPLTHLLLLLLLLLLLVRGQSFSQEGLPVFKSIAQTSFMGLATPPPWPVLESSIVMPPNMIKLS